MKSSPAVFRLVAAACAICLLPMAAAGQAERLRTFDSDYYKIHTDLDREFATDLAERMDAMYEEYVRRLEDFTVPEGQPPLEVYLFRRQADYMRFTDNRFPNTGGIFMPGRNLLAAFLEGQGRDALRRTLQHEAFHQFAQFAISPNLPVWLNEGMAQLFEEGIWSGDGFWLGQVPPRRIRQLQADMEAGRLIEFTRLLNLSHEQWAANLRGDATVGSTQYNQAWAMVHFLVHAEDRRGQPAYRDALVKMLHLIHEGTASEAAFREAFGDNVAAFQREFVEWAWALEPTAEARIIEHQDILADMLKHLNARGHNFDRVSDFMAFVIGRHYRITYTRGHMTWTTDENPFIYFSDLDGRPFRQDDHYFEPNPRAPLPDMVCAVTPEIQLRTRFHRSPSGGIDHEILIEPRW